MNKRLLALAVVVTAAVSALGAGGTASATTRGTRGDLDVRNSMRAASGLRAAESAASHARVALRTVRIAARLERLARSGEGQRVRLQQVDSRVQGFRASPSMLPLGKFTAGVRAAEPPLCDGMRATIVGTNGDDKLMGRPGRDVIAALSGNDIVYGLGHNDVICAGDGDDWVWGGAGNDKIFGGEGNDFAIGGAGDDTMDGGGQPFDAAAFFDETGPVTASLETGTATGEGSDTFTNVRQLHGGNFTDTFTGDAADNGLFGNGGNDSLRGGDGHDGLSGGDGDDSIDGGGGNFDSVTFWDATGPVTASLASGTSSGAGEGSDSFTNVEVLNGGPHGDSLGGGAGDGGLTGGGGGDSLVGGSGNEFLLGDEGDDTISGGDGNDFLTGGPGNDSFDGGPGPYDSVSYFQALGPVTGSLATGSASGEGSDTFTTAVEILDGSPFDDHLTGGPDNDKNLSGEGGNDILNGGSGNEFVFGGDGDDSIGGGDGSDWLVGGAGDDTIDGGPGDFDAVAYWNASGPVNASLATGGAIGEGSDTFASVEQIHGSPYSDNLDGGTQNGWLFGNDGADTISGGSGDEFLFGNNGDDTINGGAGDDFLAPGAGDDTLEGGSGFDKAAYWDSSGPITASLITATATGDGADTFKNLEGIHGGNHADTLSGDAGPNELFGNDGNDMLDGAAGDDSLNGWNGDDNLYGRAGNDYLDGWDGVDYADGGPDWDYCVNSETVFNCEQPRGSLLFDNFDDDSLDPAAWFPATSGTGPAVRETGQRIQIDLPATSAENPGDGVFAAGVNGTCPLRGDFDIQVDYSLPLWPPGNGVRVGLATSYGIVQRTSDPRYPDNYLVDFQGVVGGFTLTSDLAGELRLQRQGSTLSGYFRSGNDWILLYSAPTNVGDVGYAIQAWSHDVIFGDRDVTVTFDNFRLNQGERMC